MKLYASSLTVSSLWSRESNAFQRFLFKRPKTLSFRKPHRYFEKTLSKKGDIRANIILPKTLDKFESILTDLQSSFPSVLLFWVKLWHQPILKIGKHRCLVDRINTVTQIVHKNIRKRTHVTQAFFHQRPWYPLCLHYRISNFQINCKISFKESKKQCKT